MVAVNENAARDDAGLVAIELLALGLRRHLAMQHGLNESLPRERRDNEVAIGDQSARNPDDAIQAGLAKQAAMQVEALTADLTSARKARPKVHQARRILDQFEPIWTALTKQERHQFMREIVESVTLDGHTGKVAFTFRSEGFAKLANWQEKT